MGPSVQPRSSSRRHSSDGSDSPPVKVRRSPRRTNPSRREGSPPRHRRSPMSGSPKKAYSAKKAYSSQKTRSSGNEKRPSRSRSPVKKHYERPASRSPSPRSSQKTRSSGNEKRPSRSRSPVKKHCERPASRSPSPRSKRLRRDQEEKGLEKKRGGDREDSRGRARDYDSVAEAPRERRKEKSHETVSRPPRHNRSTSPPHQERSNSRYSRLGRDQSPPRQGSRNMRSRHGSSTSPRGSPARGNIEESGSRAHEQLRDNDSIAKMKAAEEGLEAKKKQKPSFELSGKLAEETNRVKGVTLLFNEPPEARKPVTRWRLYVFKSGEALNEPLYLHRQSCYLFGRERRVADVPTDHPSCSKQHAVIQYRLIEKEQPDGTLKKQVSPYLMDLGSTNGTLLNDNRIEPQRYYELFEKDTIKFGNSSREYVLLHENSSG